MKLGQVDIIFAKLMTSWKYPSEEQKNLEATRKTRTSNPETCGYSCGFIAVQDRSGPLGICWCIGQFTKDWVRVVAAIDFWIGNWEPATGDQRALL